jgi:hypothetical protein
MASCDLRTGIVTPASTPAPIEACSEEEAGFRQRLAELHRWAEAAAKSKVRSPEYLAWWCSRPPESEWWDRIKRRLAIRIALIDLAHAEDLAENPNVDVQSYYAGLGPADD